MARSTNENGEYMVSDDDESDSKWSNWDAPRKENKQRISDDDSESEDVASIHANGSTAGTSPPSAESDAELEEEEEEEDEMNGLEEGGPVQMFTSAAISGSEEEVESGHEDEPTSAFTSRASDGSDKDGEEKGDLAPGTKKLRAAPVLISKTSKTAGTYLAGDSNSNLKRKHNEDTDIFTDAPQNDLAITPTAKKIDRDTIAKSQNKRYKSSKYVNDSGDNEEGMPLAKQNGAILGPKTNGKSPAPGSQRKPQKRPGEASTSEKGDKSNLTKGTFTESEIQRLERYRAHFCADYKIDYFKFNELMSAMSVQGKDTGWSWPHHTKLEFRKEFYDVLPDRDAKSMRRWKERNWQNVDESRSWTKKDDKELASLVREVGKKWVQIGRRIGRTQDEVSQRWRFKVQYQGINNEGYWAIAERNALLEALRHFQGVLDVSSLFELDKVISWEKVSERMGKVRTAAQCSHHWRHVEREHQMRTTEKEHERKTEEKRTSARRAIPKPKNKRKKQTGDKLKPKKTSRECNQSEGDEEAQNFNVSIDDQTEHGQKASYDRELLGELSARSLNRKKERFCRKDWDAVSDVSNEPATQGRLSKRKNLSKKPMANDMSLTQAFEVTQASTHRSSSQNSSHPLSASKERPSPNIAIKLRPNLRSSNTLSSSFSNANFPSDNQHRQVDEPVHSSDDALGSVFSPGDSEADEASDVNMNDAQNQEQPIPRSADATESSSDEGDEDEYGNADDEDEEDDDVEVPGHSIFSSANPVHYAPQSEDEDGNDDEETIHHPRPMPMYSRADHGLDGAADNEDEDDQGAFPETSNLSKLPIPRAKVQVPPGENKSYENDETSSSGSDSSIDDAGTSNGADTSSNAEVSSFYESAATEQSGDNDSESETFMDRVRGTAQKLSRQPSPKTVKAVDDDGDDTSSDGFDD